MRRAFETFDMMYLVAGLFVQFIDTQKYTSIEREIQKKRSVACIFTCFFELLLLVTHCIRRFSCHSHSDSRAATTRKMTDNQRRSVCYVSVYYLIALRAAIHELLPTSQFIEETELSTEENRNNSKRTLFALQKQAALFLNEFN